MCKPKDWDIYEQGFKFSRSHKLILFRMFHYKFLFIRQSKSVNNVQKSIQQYMRYQI